MRQNSTTDSNITRDKLVNKKSDFLIDALHLFVLFGFALAQPLFDLLSKHAGFFVSRKSEPIDIILLVIILCLMLPGILVLIEGVTGLLGRRFRKAIHWFMVAILLALIALQVLSKVFEIPGLLLIMMASVLGVAATTAYIRLRPARIFLTVLSPAILIFPALFLFNSPVYKVVFPEKGLSALKINIDDPPPIIIVVFDEFPVTSLMDENCEIDPVRYPNFAALVGDAYWFRNGVTVAPTTHLAIPAILTGSYPDPSCLPTLSSYPHNLFTLLDDSYEMTLYEMETMLSPKMHGGDNRLHQTLRPRLHSLLLDLSIIYLHIILPPDFSSGLPVVTQTWKNFSGEKSKDAGKTETVARRKGSVHKRAELYAEFIEAIAISDKPVLYFFHSMLPHVPWDSLPSGKRYKKKGLKIPGLNVKEEKWYADDWLVIQGYQRHLLQVGYVDKLVGDLIKRLKDLNIYDRCFIIITADHGVNFWPGKRRRSVLKDDPMGILGVPVIIKAPNQDKGKIVDLAVETIDILPIIADVLNIDIPWNIDGSSVLDSIYQGRSSMARHMKGVVKPAVAEKSCIKKYPSLERKLRLFGSGNLDGIFKIGTHKNLVGQSIDGFKIEKNKSVTIDLDHKQEVYDFVDTKAEFMPEAYVTGKINPKRVADSPLHLAVVVNGTIRAVTRSFLNKKDEIRFTALVPESAFLMGRNHVEVLIVSVGENGQTSLCRPKNCRQITYSLSSSGQKFIRHPDDVSIPIVSNGVDGRVKSRVRAYNIYISGWAADIKNSRVPDAIVILENDKFFSSQIPQIVRRDVAKYFDNQALKKTGFEFVFPSSSIKDTATYRFFAIFDDIASELKYPKGYKWKKEASSGTRKTKNKNNHS